jgi:hypothetical protein
MFHLKPNPRPPSDTGRVTPWNAVDSSPIITTPSVCMRLSAGVEALSGLDLGTRDLRLESPR